MRKKCSFGFGSATRCSATRTGAVSQAPSAKSRITNTTLTTSLTTATQIKHEQLIGIYHEPQTRLLIVYSLNHYFNCIIAFLQWHMFVSFIILCIMYNSIICFRPNEVIISLYVILFVILLFKYICSAIRYSTPSNSVGNCCKQCLWKCRHC